MSDENEISEAERKERFERWERLGVDVIRTDLEATGGLRFVGGRFFAQPARAGSRLSSCW